MLRLLLEAQTVQNFSLKELAGGLLVVVVGSGCWVASAVGCGAGEGAGGGACEGGGGAACCGVEERAAAAAAAACRRARRGSTDIMKGSLGVCLFACLTREC